MIAQHSDAICNNVFLARTPCDEFRRTGQSRLRNSTQERTMTGGGWSCPHEVNGLCSKINNLPCDPGMKGCELYGRYAFFDGSKNTRLLQKRARAADAAEQEAPEED
jgi:hypothetical protein